jgi:hypothetical protein
MRIRFSAVRAIVGVSLLTSLSACFTQSTVAAALGRASAGVQTIAPNASSTPLTVTVSDQEGDSKENVPIVWSIRSGSGALSATQTDTNDDGESSVTFTAGASQGTAIVVATQPTLGTSVSFTIIVKQ